MNKIHRGISLCTICVGLVLLLSSCLSTVNSELGSDISADHTSSHPSAVSPKDYALSAEDIDEQSEYSDRDSVALYIYSFGHLPSNYVSKAEARRAGWISSEGNLWEVLPGKSIGGSIFYNDEEKLPDTLGRTWYECDIDYEGGYRNEKRLVYSSDRLVYYTNNHYRSFEQLY